MLKSIVMEKQTILVVEDNSATIEALQAILELDGFQVYPAVHGQQALEILRAEPVDLILADISMPVMDGFELYQQVRKQPEWIGLPFIFLTARGERSDVFKGKELGAEDYLVKPITRQELLASVRSRLERNRVVMLAQMEQSYVAASSLLANAIEQRGRTSPTDVEQVVEYALAISVQLNAGEVIEKALHFGGILHDIGKILIRDEILSKIAALDEDEWAELRLHPILGVRLIENIPYLAQAIPVIRHHHERWDGRGYPDGLSGEQIPLEARIMAVADTLDAMLTSRYYRQALTPEEAYQEIVAASGSRFDPQVVSAFLAAWENIYQRIPYTAESGV